MRNYIFCLLWLCGHFVPNNLWAQFHLPVFPALESGQLANATVTAFKPNRVLNYSDARDIMYGEIYKVKDSVSCIYSGHRLPLPGGVDPSIFLYMNGSNDGINAEHVFPQSKGADEDNGNPHSDLHHIFPTRTRVNSARSNFPFREIPDRETTSWFLKNQINSQRPSSNIDLYSERINGGFEPPEYQKGNIARAMFYFYTMYQQEADDADPNFFESQRLTLCDWHQLDPVDSLEWERTFMIAEYQDMKPNPFVLDCSLAARLYCPFIVTNCSTIVSANEFISDFEYDFTVFPSPASEQINIRLHVMESVSARFNFYDAFGRKIFFSETERLASGENLISLPVVGSGFVILEVEFINSSERIKIRRKVILGR